MDHEHSSELIAIQKIAMLEEDVGDKQGLSRAVLHHRVEKTGLHNRRCKLEVYMRYTILWLYLEYGTLIQSVGRYGKLGSPVSKPHVGVSCSAPVPFGFYLGPLISDPTLFYLWGRTVVKAVAEKTSIMDIRTAICLKLQMLFEYKYTYMKNYPTFRAL